MQLERGILFKSARYSFVVPLEQTHSIVQEASILSLPWTESWMLGTAHLNGMALPITDFRLFCTDIPYTRNPRSESIIIFKESEWMYGLLITTLIGMRDFEAKSLSSEIPDDLRVVESCISGQARVDGQECLVLNIQKLLQVERFMKPVKLSNSLVKI